MLSVKETVPAASTLTVGDPAWTCVGGPPDYACNTLAAADIAVGASITVPLQVAIPLAPLEGAGCSLPNTAAIVAPAGGSADNFDAADDADTAVADAFLTWVDIFGVTQVTCDPTNLKTTKLSKGDCVAAATISAASTRSPSPTRAPTPITARSKVSEQLGFAPTSVVVLGPLGLPGRRRQLPVHAPARRHGQGRQRRARRHRQCSGRPPVRADQPRGDGLPGRRHALQQRHRRRPRRRDVAHPGQELREARPAAMRAGHERAAQQQRRLRLQDRLHAR